MQRTRTHKVEEDFEEIVKTPRKRTRAVKEASGGHKDVKEKFVEERKTVTPLRPMNELQAEYIRLINTKSLIISTGFPGTSKTYIPTVMACDKLRNNEIDRLYLTRPNISNSKTLGYFSGDVVQKMSFWLAPILSTLFDRMGRAAAEIAIKNGDITFVPLETIKGMSFGKNSFVICDEAEDITIQEAKSIVTRQGGGTMVLAGDIEQTALDKNSGLAWLKEMVSKHLLLQDTTGFVDFNRPSDIVRSEACKAWILAMRKG